MGKKSSKSSSRTIYGNTMTTNPYVTSQTNNSGTTSVFNQGTAFDNINNFVNSNMSNLLEEYLNPTLNSITNRAKMNSFVNTLNAESAKNLENNIINPLSNRNMIRSSQATNLYNNLVQNNANQIGAYANELLANSQANTADILNNLMLLYMNGYNAIMSNQQQSLSSSQGNASQSQTNTSSSDLTTQLLKMATDIALSATAAKKGV